MPLIATNVIPMTANVMVSLLIFVPCILLSYAYLVCSVRDRKSDRQTNIKTDRQTDKEKEKK